MYRLTSITTRGGDGGFSRLADGRSLPKNHLIFHCLGTQDELQAQLGLALCALDESSPHRASLQEALNTLFDLGGELAYPQHPQLSETDTASLEKATKELNALLPPLREFVLPGPPEAAARIHMARSLCRRLERLCWELHQQEPLNLNSLVWLNRFSDWLFVLARTLTLEAGCKELTWRRRPRDS